ncbi:cyclic nucleotide-binding domain protein (macronuclear) [Tetrahymena thermophila SB210]|uniref:Cyclic nucleotide-binding domain protein n=1 Tax=Tetrahymena thermophila (strain SB210) TaxID=312017 RepID=Q22XU4_TETTS|nr:cyclic nucleotide-binding domain protein [Tetrahymena thermophila SB210]EAR90077.2 cyclic nucleotide-binding domain protein [Tetrahymena thermophila SB210]|eukprot:XP_001010322.2 cyclic nucleotide-binding domain protein [Tetrahymena thermophila SB210]
MFDHQSDYINRGSTTRRNFLSIENGGEDRNYSQGAHSPTTLDLRKLNFFDRNSISDGNLGFKKQRKDQKNRDNNENQLSQYLQSSERKKDKSNADDDEDNSSSQDYSDEKQDVAQEDVQHPQTKERRNGYMIEHKKSKFNDLIFQIRLKNQVKRLANSINTRMFKNLSHMQYKMIGDNSSDRTYTKHFSYTDNGSSQGDQDYRDRKNSIITKFMKQIDIFLPAFNPRSILKVYLEILNLVSILLIFFFMSIIISFKMNIDDLVPHIVIEISFGLIFVNSFVNLNTGYYEDMKLSKDRQQMFSIYLKTHFYVDISSFISILMLLIFDKTSFLQASSSDQNAYNVQVSDLGTLFRWIVFIPFIFKLRDFSKFMIAFEEKIIFQKQEQNIIQLIKLFASIILIDHFMACIWICVSKLSYNIDSSWQTKRGCQDDVWFRQYTLAFYYSTVTMTTVGYGDIVPTNETETLVAIFMMLFSSGVFGFTLNQIGMIFTEMYSEVKEARRKMKIINIHMEKRKVKHPLRMQIRQYLDYIWKENSEQIQMESAQIIEQLNDSLKKELQLHQNEKIINYFSKHFSEAFISKAFSLIKEVQCKPQQLIYKGGSTDNLSLYLIEKGKVEVYYKTKAQKNTPSKHQIIHEIQEGQLFGITQFYTGLPRDLNIRAIGFVSLLKISRDEFINLLEQFPDDKEAFCYIRDSLIFYQDGYKSSSQCPSCGSFKHNILNCGYLHYEPNIEKTCLRYNYIPPKQKQIERRKYIRQKDIEEYANKTTKEETEESFRKRGKLQTRYDLPQHMEQLYLDQFELIEEYEMKYLHYNFDFTFMASQKEQKEWAENKDKEEYQDDNVDNNNFISKLQEESSKNIQNINKQLSQSQDQSAMVQYDQVTDFEKQTSIIQFERENSGSNYSPLQKKNSIVSPTKRGHMREREFSLDQKPKTQVPQVQFKGPRRLSNQAPVNSPSTRNNQRPKSIIFSDAFEKQYTPSDFSRLSNENKQGLQDNQQTNGNNINQQNTVTFNLPNGKVATLYRVQEEPILPTLQMQKIVSADQASSYFHQPFITNQINSSHNIPQPNSSTRNTEKNSTSIKRALSIKMKSFSNHIMKHLEKLIQKNKQPNEIQKALTIDETDEQYGLTQIFRHFDKQKNFFVYFPLNNLSYLLMKLETKSQIGKKFYLDILQQKKKQPLHQNSSQTLFRNKYEKLRIKTDKVQNKGSRGNSMYTSKRTVEQPDHVNVNDQEQAKNNLIHNRKSAFFEKFQIESPVTSLTDNQFNLLSAKQANNQKLSFNFLKNEVQSQQEIIFDSNPQIYSSQEPGELSPNVIELDQEQAAPDYENIHKLQFRAKKTYKSPLS